MSADIIWGPNWSGTRLHAIPSERSPFMYGRQDALCGTEAYPKPPTGYCAARFNAGLERCKTCERAVAKMDASK